MKASVLYMSAMFAVLGAAQVHASDFSGLYVGGTVGMNTSVVSGTPSASQERTTAFGIQEGYNWDVDNLVAGVNYFVDFNSKRDRKNITSELGSVVLGLDLKLGMPMDNGLPYVKLGWARTTAQGSYNPVRHFQKKNGMHWAVGYEYKFDANWSVAADYSGSRAKSTGTSLSNKNLMFSLNYYVGKISAETFSWDSPRQNLASSAEPEPVEMTLPAQEPIAPRADEFTSSQARVATNRADEAPLSTKEIWKTLREERPLIIPGAHFAFGSAQVSSVARKNLYETVQFANENRSSTLNIAGHTDSVGSEAYNQTLSERRAHAVRDYLIKAGIEASRITTTGYGETQPVASNKTNAGRAKNRRVEIHSVIVEEKRVRSE